MRSPDSARTVLENALRVASVLGMATLAVRFWSGAVSDRPRATATTLSLDSALVAWSATAPHRATVRATVTPDARQRDWLRALARTGSRISWSSEDTLGSALVIEAGPSPAARARLALLGTPRTRVPVSDVLGRVDSIRLGPDGVAWMALQPLGTVRVALGSSDLVAVPRDSLFTRPVLVIGAAGWEAKFVAAALEEDGWAVSTRMQVAPGAVVRQGSALAIDTGSYSAVIVIDSVSPLDGNSMTRFVNEGGGLVATGPGVRHPALRSLLPRQTTQIPAELGGLLGQTPRIGLNTRGLAVSANHVVFDRRGTVVTASAKRVGAGRVVALGYDDTWRMRIIPPNDEAPTWHRQWWSSIVGGVAKVGLVSRHNAAIDEAPLAATVAALGPQIAIRADEQDDTPFPWDALLAALAAAALLGEWLSRRLRGVA